MKEAVALLEVRQTGPPEAAQLVVSVTTNRTASRARIEVTEVLQRMLGLNVDLSDFYRLAEGDLHLRPLARRFRGVKPPRFGSVFECLVNAIACQQLSLTVGIGLLNRLTECYGRTVDRSRAQHAFPIAPDLAKVDPGELRRLGFSNAKARAVVELAQAASGRARPRTDGRNRRRSAVRRIPAAPRNRPLVSRIRIAAGLGLLDVFPGDDVGARNNLQRFLGLDPNMDYDARPPRRVGLVAVRRSRVLPSAARLRRPCRVADRRNRTTTGDPRR